MEPTEDRAKPIADWARESLTYDQLVDIFAAHVVEYVDLKTLLLDVMQTAESQGELLRQLSGEVKEAGLKAKLLKKIAESEQHLQRFVAAGAELERKDAAAVSARKQKAAADARHSKPGGNRDKRAAIQAAWASGNFSSRGGCAEQQCAALDMSIDTARKALINTPDPHPWPAKKRAGRPKKT